MKLFVVMEDMVFTRIVIVLWVLVPPSIVCRHQTVFNLRLKPFILPTTQTEATGAAAQIKPNFLKIAKCWSRNQFAKCVSKVSPKAIRFLWTTHIFPLCSSRLFVTQPLIIRAGRENFSNSFQEEQNIVKMNIWMYFNPKFDTNVLMKAFPRIMISWIGLTF